MVLLPVLAAIAAPIRFARCEPHDRSAYSVLPGLCRQGYDQLDDRFLCRRTFA